MQIQTKTNQQKDKQKYNKTLKIKLSRKNQKHLKTGNLDEGKLQSSIWKKEKDV